jgi:uncharacterized protein (TIGR02466 family)
MTSKPFFPTRIYCSPLVKTSSNKFNDELLLECQKIKDFDKKGRAWSAKNYVGGYTSYASIPQLHNFSSTFLNLEKKITKHVKSYVNELELDLRGRNIGMSDCWLNMMPAQTTHGLHLHPNSFISGTYYVSTPKDSAAIKFEDPRLERFMYAPPKKANAKRENQPFVSFPVERGMLVLFESWLRHEVPASTNTTERVSVSFNYSWW